MTKVLKSGVLWGLLASAALSVWILDGLHGWAYYRTPLSVRGYAPDHRLLRPSGPFGQSFGLFGAVLLLVPFLYMLRKRLGRSTRVQSLGSLKTWLEVHLFCGIVGPVLVTYHTSFKFNGIVSAAYWSMMVVMLSGFVGRYLYVRIPRTLRGTELSHAELDGRAGELLSELAVAAGPGPWLDRVRGLERAIVPSGGRRLSIISLLFGEIPVRLRLRRLAREVHHSDLSPLAQHELVRLMTERALLLRRIAYLQKTKSAFSLWHVLHVPLVYLLLVIASLHIALALYMGYVPFRWS